MKLQFEPFYQEYLDVLAAYDLASATMYTDQWTVAPKGGIPNSSAKMATLSKLAFKVENDPETVEKIKAYYQTLPEGSLEQKEVKMRLDELALSQNASIEEFEALTKARNEAEYQ